MTPVFHPRCYRPCAYVPQGDLMGRPTEDEARARIQARLAEERTRLEVLRAALEDGSPWAVEVDAELEDLRLLDKQLRRTFPYG